MIALLVVVLVGMIATGGVGAVLWLSLYSDGVV